MKARQLPPLPVLPMPDGTLYGPDRTVRGHSFLPAKVREYAIAYALAAVAAEREACAVYALGPPGIDDQEAYCGRMIAEGIRDQPPVTPYHPETTP